MRFSVYFDSILNEKKKKIHREIMISAAHMLGSMLSSDENLKNVQLSASWCTFLADFEKKKNF